MTYGLAITNDTGSAVIDDEFRTMSLFATMDLPWVSLAGAVFGAQGASGCYATIPADTVSNSYFVVFDSPYLAFGQARPALVSTPGGLVDDPDNLAVGIIGNAIPSGTTLRAHVFTSALTTVPPGGWGLSVNNSAGVEIFNSERQGIDVISPATLAPASFTETTLSISNPGGVDIGLSCPMFANGYYATADKEYSVAVRKISNSQIGYALTLIADYSGGGKGGIPSADRRRSAQIPICRLPT